MTCHFPPPMNHELCIYVPKHQHKVLFSHDWLKWQSIIWQGELFALQLDWTWPRCVTNGPPRIHNNHSYKLLLQPCTTSRAGLILSLKKMPFSDAESWTFAFRFSILTYTESQGNRSLRSFSSSSLWAKWQMGEVVVGEVTVIQSQCKNWKGFQNSSLF